MTLCGDTDGIVIIIFALMLPLIVGFVGLGVETALWFSEKRSLQTAADAAALAGVYEYNENGSGGGGILTKATTDATRNGYDNVGGDTIAVNNPPIIGANTADATAVEVTLTRTINFLFASFVLPGGSLNISARAVAASSAKGDACILALSPTEDSAFKVSGNITLDMDCGIAVKSTSSKGADFSGNSTIDITALCVEGQTNNSGNNSFPNAQPNDGCNTAPDPSARAGRRHPSERFR